MADYVVWSNEHSAWWGPDSRDYYAKLENAGRYTRDEALRICKGARGGRRHNANPTEVPLLLADAEQFWTEAGLDERRRQERDALVREIEAAEAEFEAEGC